jgi:hypothetical protein
MTCGIFLASLVLRCTPPLFTPHRTRRVLMD